VTAILRYETDTVALKSITGTTCHISRQYNHIIIMTFISRKSSTQQSALQLCLTSMLWSIIPHMTARCLLPPAIKALGACQRLSFRRRLRCKTHQRHWIQEPGGPIRQHPYWYYQYAIWPEILNCDLYTDFSVWMFVLILTQYISCDEYMYA